MTLVPPTTLPAARVAAARVRDAAELRDEFPALRRLAWLNCAGIAPGATPVVEALEHAQCAWRDGSCDWMDWEHDADAARAALAHLVGADPETVALVATCAEAAATVAHSLPDPSSSGRARIVVAEREFRSNLFPWLALEARGFEVHALASPGGIVRTDDFLAAIDERVALVAVTEVQSSSGVRIDAAAIAAACRQSGARLFLNLTQSLGALRFDAPAVGADYVAVHAYKWLCAPRGAAFLHVRAALVDEASPLTPNWKNVAEPYASLYGGPPTLATSARRLDASLAWFPWVGARAALEMLAGFSAEAVERRALELAEAFRHEARRLGILTAPVDMPSQLVAVRPQDLDGVQARMRAAGVVTSSRDGWLRIGFHAFNDACDLERAVAVLSAAG